MKRTEQDSKGQTFIERSGPVVETAAVMYSGGRTPGPQRPAGRSLSR